MKDLSDPFLAAVNTDYANIPYISSVLARIRASSLITERFIPCFKRFETIEKETPSAYRLLPTAACRPLTRLSTHVIREIKHSVYVKRQTRNGGLLLLIIA